MSNITLNVQTEEEINLNAESITEVNTSDYEKLTNKPTINGTPLIGNYNEIDPTVPEWAKQPNPPSTEDIGAINADDYMGADNIKDLWDSIFTN